MRARYSCQAARYLGLALCLLIASGINAETTCRRGCPESDNGNLQYVPGNVYEYNFDSVMTVGLIAEGAAASVSETDNTNLKILGNAKVFAEGNCGYVLQLNAVKVTATKEAVEHKITQNIQKPVHFTMVNGKVEAEICADAGDNAYSLNVKRAVISLFQSNVASESAEVDVFGQCPTHTTVSKVGNAEIITKVRNLNSCAYREHLNSGIVNGVVNDNAGVKSTILFQADYSKESKLDHGVIENVQLVEDYKFAGAPKGGPDVHAKVVTTLKLKNAVGTQAAAPVTGTKSASILFQHPEVYAAKNIAALKASLSEIVTLIDDYVQKDSAKNFVELIRLMRSADADTLLELAAFPHPNKVLARKVYLDALFRTGTAESAKAIMKQLNKMEEKEKLIAVLSLNLVQTVDKETLSQAADLLTATATKEVFLSVGNLISKYCQRNGCKQSDIESISKKFTDNLKHCKANTKKDEERIVYILKGIANTHHLANSFTSTLTECAATGRSNRIRVAALQAFPAASCDATLQTKAMELLADLNEDSELRIEAYLAIINCPTAELANQIADIVNNEKVYQVGGFITSNLKALRDSTDSTRENQRHYLGNIRITKHFPKDYRRYSFNNELSYKFDALGASASADYKLLYSQHGFLPRSLHLNVTTEIFGTNFNVFQASIRQENIENVLEYYVGPKGLLNKDLDEIIGIVQNGGGGDTGRQKRAITDDTTKFSKKYKNYGTKNVQDLNLDLSLKLFGSEMVFLSLGDNIPSSLEEIIKHFSSAYEDVKKELSAFSKEFNMHALFLDTTVSYPTGLGFPLELSTQGFAANKLDFGVNIAVDSILEQSWQHAKYRLKVVPSVDVNVNVKLGFNAYVLSTGIRVVSSLHSAVGSDVNLEFINDGNGFHTDIEFPRRKMELIDLQVNTDFYVTEQDKSTKSIALKGVKKRKQENNEVCFNQLETIGLTFCFTSSLTNTVKSTVAGKVQALTDESNLYRPFNFNMYVLTERKISLKGCHIAQTATGSQQWKLDYSTPDSKESHDTSLAFELGTKPRTYGRISFDNPQYHFGLEAGVNNDNKELVLYAQYEHDQETKKNKIGFVKNGNEYRPVIEIQDNNGVTDNINGYRADGKVVVQQISPKQSRYSFENFQVINKDNERIIVNGWAEIGTNSLSSELHVAPGQQAYFVKSNFKLENGEYDIGFFINDEKTPDNIIGGSAQIKLADQGIDVQLVGKAGTWEIYSGNAVQYVKLEGASTIASSKFNNELKVKRKESLVGSFKLNGLTESENKIEVSAETVRGKKVASLAVKVVRNQRSRGDYNIEVNGKYNKHFIDFLAKCDINGNHFVLDNALITSWGTDVTVKGEIGQRYSPQDIHIDLQGTAQFSDKEKQIQWLLKVIGAPEKTISEFKATRDNAELVKYNGETQHPQDKISSGKINLVVRNLIIAKADFKIAKNGKGDITASLEMQKTEKHKIEVTSKFHVQAPKYDIETTLTFDANKKLYVKTENILDKTKFATKSTVEVADKKITLDANGSLKGDWRSNGEQQGNFVLTCPMGRIIDGSIKRKITTNAKTGVAQGNMELHLSDQLPNGGKKRTIVSTGKIEKFVVKAKEFAVASHLIYTNFDGQKLDLTYELKKLPKGQNNMLEFNTAVRGDLLSNPIDIEFAVDEYGAKNAVYHASAKYGEELSANVNGNYNLGERGQPAAYEVQGNLQVPKSELKSLKVSSKGKLIRPETEAGGTYMIELYFDEKTGNDKFVKLNTVFKGSRQQGAYLFEVETKEMQSPLKLDGTYQREQQGNIKDGTASGKQSHVFNFSYADKYIKTTTALSYVGVDTASLHCTLDSSFESLKNIDVELLAQKLEADSYAVKLQANHDRNVYGVDSKIFRSTHKKGLDLHVTLPNNQPPIVVVSIFELLGERKAKFLLQVEHLIGLDLKATAEASYKNVDDFYVLAQWNSAKLNLDSYDLDVRSQGKAITLNLKNAQGTIFAGSATYALKKEKNKAIIEGQGQVLYKGKSQSSNFKLIRQVYDIASDNELGFSYTFNGNFGPKNGVSTLKITNKDFNIKLSACEEKKQCSNLQIQSIVTADEQELDSTQHSLLVLIDLRELGYPYEFELQSKTIRQGFKIQYSLDSNIISNNNLKYQLIANVLPTGSKVQLKLPQREIVYETQQQIPAHGQLFGHYEHAIAFYFDKTKEPNNVVRLVSSADISGVERVAVNAKGQIKFEHASIRPLIISGKFDANREQHVVDAEVVLDIFNKPEQKVIATSNVKNIQAGHGFNITTRQVLRSTGLHFLYEFNGHTALKSDQWEFSSGAEVNSGTNDIKANAFVYGNKERLEVAVNALGKQILQFSGNFNRQKYITKLQSKWQIISQTPIEFITEIQPTAAKISVKRQGLVDANAEIKLGKEAKFSVEGAGKQLFDGRVALDAANFLQTTYTSNNEDVKAYLDTVVAEAQKDHEGARIEIKNRFQKFRQIIDEQVELSMSSRPDFSGLISNYQNNINKLVNELEADPSLRQIAEQYREIYAKFSKIAENISRSLTDLYNSLHKSFAALFEKWQIFVKDTVIPTWEEFLISVTKILSVLRVEIINLYTKAFQKLLSIVESYAPALKNYGKEITESLKPFNEAAQELFKVIAHVTEEFISELKEYIAKLPTFEALRTELKVTLEKLKLSEKVLDYVNQLFDQMQILPQTPETIELLQKAHEYIVSKIKQQPVNDEQLVEELVKLFVKAVRSIWVNLNLTANANMAGLSPANNLSAFFGLLPASVDVFGRLPALLSFRFNVFNFLLNENWESIFSKDRLKSWIFFHEFDLKGHVADGHHIFTFDGQYLSFPGTCKYILAQDSVDNNFTVIAQLNNGKLKSIILTDRDGSFVEITDTGVLKLNGQPAEFPQHDAGMHAWRLFYTVWLRSEYGVGVMCTSDLKVCHVDVNGFYTSKIRGLLGNGNAEPYDDFMQADGNIAPDYAIFGNGYGLGKCAVVAVEPSQESSNIKHTDICNEIFGLDSTLAMGYLFLHPGVYRTACDNAVNAVAEKDKESAACNIATAYGSALKLSHKFVIIPVRCLKCAGAAGQRELGQEFSMKIPNNKADIVFVVDLDVTPVVLKNLVAPTITEVRDTLKARGFTDIQIGVVAYNKSQQYPALLTSDNGKLNYQANIAELQLNGPNNIADNIIAQVNEKKILEVYELINNLVKSIVPQSDEKAFRMAMNYPFRAGAAKSFIGVRSDSLDHDNLLRAVRSAISSTVGNVDAAILHLIAPVKGLTVEGLPTEKIVGFNSRLIATLDGKDAKKRQKLQFADDLGINLVLDKGGWVFATQNFDSMKPQDQKKAVNQVTSTIADSLFKTDIVTDCVCLPIHGLHAQHKCSIKSSTFVPNKKVKAT